MSYLTYLIFPNYLNLNDWSYSLIGWKFHFQSNVEVKFTNLNHFNGLLYIAKHKELQCLKISIDTLSYKCVVQVLNHNLGWR